MTTRPKDLPDFAAPPLNEVVVGVQFAPAQGYSQIRAGEVWALFKPEFPSTEEHPVLPPTFETFGRPQQPPPGIGFITGASHDRFWFVSSGKEELIQFQEDRLIHNWRKMGDESSYPRFETMIEKFNRELCVLESYFQTLAPQKLAINQAEISYVNHIPLDPENLDPSEWLRYVQLGSIQVGDFNMSFRRVLTKNDQPVARLTCEAKSAISKGKTILRLGLTARGAPSNPDIPSALEFLYENREIVVRAFAEVTTKSAHKLWRRTQ